MATYEQRDNSGALFKNDKKTEAKHPDYQGDCLINSEKMRISAWLKESNGKKFMSLAFSAPYVPNSEHATLIVPATPKIDVSFDDDLPF